MRTFEEISKEQVSALSYPAGDVLMDQELRKNRLRALHQATSLGNLERGKVRIRFVTADGPKEVFTTIWHHSDEHVVLKGGKAIPVRSIVEVVL